MPSGDHGTLDPRRACSGLSGCRGSGYGTVTLCWAVEDQGGLGALSWENLLNLLDFETHEFINLYENDKIKTNAHNRLGDTRHEIRKFQHTR